MFSPFIFALLAFSSVTATSDPGCDELFKPLEDRTKIYGKWILYAVGSDTEEYMKAKKVASSSWMEISPIPGSDDLSLHYMEKIDGKCTPGAANATTSGNFIKVVFHHNSSSYDHTGRFLETCPDCLLWTDETVMEVDGVSKKSKNLCLLTKKGKLDASHLDVFKKQVMCLTLSTDFYFPDTTDLCPDEKEPAADRTTEEQ